MKAMLISVAVLGLAGFLIVAPVSAQSAAGKDGGTSDRWVSHQMNQPRPVIGKRRAVSQERVEDMRRLYELAKKEAEARAKAKAPSPK